MIQVGVTKDFGVSVHPQSALVFTHVENRYGARRSVITRHDFEDGPSGPVLGAGRLVSADDVDALLVGLRSGRDSTRSPFIPADVVGLSASFAAWFVPSAVRPMWFRTDRKTFSVNARWPHLVIACAPGGVYVCAVRSPVTRGQDVAVYHAPLMNIYNDGGVCMPGGTTVVGGLDGRELAEQVVFATNFSHVNHPHTLRMDGKKKDVDTAKHLAFWRARSTRKDAFPSDALVPMRMKLSRWLASVQGGSRG